MSLVTPTQRSHHRTTRRLLARRGTRAARVSLVAVVATLGALPGAASATDACPIPGDPIHWQADYCLFVTETDDIIAAGPCMQAEGARAFPEACAAKRHYKRLLCGFALRDGWRKGTLAECLDDPTFQGTTVENGGA